MEKPKPKWIQNMDFSGMKSILGSMSETLNNMTEVYKIKKQELEIIQKKMNNGNGTNSMD